MTETEQELLARVVAQEMMLISTMALLFSMTGNDPKWEKMRAVLSGIQQIAAVHPANLPPSVRQRMTAILSDMCRQVAANAIGQPDSGNAH